MNIPEVSINDSRRVVLSWANWEIVQFALASFQRSLPPLDSDFDEISDTSIIRALIYSQLFPSKKV